MSLSIERARTKRRVTWLTIVGVVMLPVLIGGILVASLWNPTDRLDHIRAAIVNEDQAVTINGQLAPLGRQLTAGLVEGTDEISSNIDWVISNPEDAKSGLADGTYQAAITIPENFSAAATSTAGTEPQQAKISITTSPDARVFDDVITGQIASIAASTMGQSLSKVYLENVLLGFTTLNEQLGTAADGATKLADGAKQTADGTGELASGAQQLADGAGQAATGTHELADGIGQLGSGAAQLSDGTGALAAQTGQFADGAGQLSSGLTQLAQGADAAVAGAQTFEDQVRQGAEQAAQSQMIPQELLDNAQAAADGSLNLVHELIGTDPNPAANPGGLTAELGGLATDMGTQAQTLGGLAETCFADGMEQAFCEQLAAVAAAYGAQAQGVGDAAGTAGTLAGDAGSVALAAGTANGYAQGVATELPRQISEQLTGIADGLTALRVGPDGKSGLALLAGSLTTVATSSGELASGASQIDGGVQQLATGAAALSSGVGQTADGASQLAAGADQLATGTTGIADGASQLKDGTTQLSDGTQDLATGLGEAVQKIPTYTDAEARKLSEVVANPVSSGSSAAADMFGGSAIPLLAIFALWFGSLASYVAIQAVSRRALASRAPSALLALRSFLPGALIGAVQGVLLSLIVQFATKYDMGEWFAFAGIAALAGVAFAAINQALVALFGGAGRWISAVAGVLFFATGVVSTTPGLLTSLADWLPTGPAYTALLTVVTPAQGGGGAIAGLIVWLLMGLTLTTLAVARKRSTSARVLRAAGI